LEVIDVKRKKQTRKLARRLPPAYASMLRLMFWTAFFVTLGLGHIHLRMVTRDLQIQRARLQVEQDELYNSLNTIKTAVSRLRDNEMLRARAKTELGLIECRDFKTRSLPEEIADGYDRAYSEIALARRGSLHSSAREPLVPRLLGTVLLPDAQAEPAPEP
jgi:cell division protein FtsB